MRKPSKKFSVILFTLTLVVFLNLYVLRLNESFDVYNGYLEGGVHYRAYLPKGLRGNQLAVLIHGFGGSAEMMNMIGSALAENGITALAYDVPGHGKSAGSLYENISEAYVDFLKAIDKAKEFGVETSSIAIVGHSMGAGYAQVLAKNDSRVKCIVLLGAYPNSQVLSGQEKLNLLVLNGAYDELVNTGRCLKVFENVTGLKNVEVGKVYGSFREGDAREFYVSGFNDHLTVLYSGDSVERVVDWVTEFYGVGHERSLTWQRLTAYILCSISTFALIFPLADAISSKLPKGELLDKRAELTPILIYFITTFLASSFTLFLQTLLYAVLPLFVSDFIISFFYTQVVAMLATLYFYEKFFNIGFMEVFKKYFRTDQAAKRIVSSIAIFSVVYLAYVFMFQNFLNVELSTYRLGYFILSTAILLPYTFFNELFYRGLVSSLCKRRAFEVLLQIALRIGSLILYYLPIAMLLGFSTGMAGYLLIVTYMLAIMQVGLDMISSTIFARTRSVTEQVIWTALTYSAVLTSISPLI